MDGSVLGEVSCAAGEEVVAAVERAACFQPTWGRLPFARRAECLARAQGILLRRADEVARLVTREQGKPVTESMLAEVMTGLGALAHALRETPRHLREIRAAHSLPFMADKKAWCRLEPRGVTSILSSWNYPFSIAFCQAVTCVAAGNTVVLRPSSRTPLTGRIIGEIFHEAGIPQEALQVVTCTTEAAGALVAHPAVRVVVFTGSTRVGREILTLASGGFRKVILELGGKDPFLVFEDANLERAARAAVWSGFMNCGQTCAATERVYVQRPVAEAFEKLVVEHASALAVGDPLDPDTEVGPMTTRDGLERVERHVQDALERGARLLVGGRRREGLYYEPTVLADVTQDMLVMQEETFGPVLPIATFDTEDEAIRLANDSEYGLTASLWTRDRARSRRLVPLIEAGTVTVNDANFTFADAAAPWGGVKAAGQGRTHGWFGLLDLVEVKFVSEDWSDRPRQLWWYPYDGASLAFFEQSLQALFSPTLAARLAGLSRLLPHVPRLAREASLPHIAARLPQMLRG